MERGLACTGRGLYTAPMDANGRKLILSDGGLSSLVAIACVKEALTLSSPARAGDAAILAFGCAGPAREMMLRAVRAQAQAYAFQLLPELEAWLPEDADAMRRREGESIDLVRACFAGARGGCDSLVWPVQCSREGTSDPDALDLDWIARASDKAVLAGRLAAVDADVHAKPSLAIDTPYVDVTDGQLADLASEMDLPVRTCWWWAVTRRDGEAAVAERAKWLRVLARAGWSVPAGA